ncbi:MAG TPA: hypothetical protein VK638_20870 [Edaphobacter sp.]|jgi:hypothetical protein|nr:hypothetical protein [Edaphobacter sp.]
MYRIARPAFVLNIALFIAAPISSLAQQAPSEQPPAQANGKWNLYCHDPNGGTSTKYIDIQQNGSEVKGHFKGPNQSGGIEGTVNQQHIVFRTKTREVLVFRGRIDGQRVGGVVQGTKITGTFHDRGGTGIFEGVPDGN